MTDNIHWLDHELFDKEEKVGRVVRTLAGNYLGWVADPYWGEEIHFFHKEDEAKAWLITTYSMEGKLCMIENCWINIKK
jgi:hypothetical protein